MDRNYKFDSIGVMLDCSRNGVLTVSQIKKFIIILKNFGYNRMLMYMEDTYEVDNEPFFGYFRGKYSQDELKEIDSFAYDNGIELIPCIQTLAHLPMIMRWKEYSEMFDIDDIMLVGDERTYVLIDNMISSLRKCFRTDKIHIGMDEAYRLGKGKYRDLNGELSRDDIFFSHLEKVCNICEKYSFNPMIWSDMFYRIASGDEDESQFSFASTKKINFPKNLTLVYWDYYHIDNSFHETMLKKHKRITDNIAYAGGIWKWSSFVPNNLCGIKSNIAAIDACVNNDVKNIFVTLWGDNGAECSVFSVLPALAYIICYANGISDLNLIKDFFKAKTGYEYDDFMLLDYPDKSEGVACNYVINPSKYQLYNDCFMGIYDCGVYKNDGEYYSKLSERIRNTSAFNGEFGYIFKNIANLCSLLEYKSEIGLKTREIYNKKDKTLLGDLISDYKIMIERTQRFYKSFRKQWFNENKANGFEVHDIRLGGLIMRMQNCHDRLCDYKDGIIDSIPELEENVLPIIEKKELVWKWSDIVTTNIL